MTSEVMAAAREPHYTAAMDAFSAEVAAEFGPLLRSWRAARSQSQLALSLHAGVSSRHLRDMETGQAKPGRKMVRRSLRAAHRDLAGLRVAFYSGTGSTVRSDTMLPVLRVSVGSISMTHVSSAANG
jgi:hypothetical protein